PVGELGGGRRRRLPRRDVGGLVGHGAHVVAVGRGPRRRAGSAGAPGMATCRAWVIKRVVASTTPSSTQASMVAEPQRWLVTGGAGFSGSHLVEALLGAGRCGRVLDNFATARRETLERLVRPEWRARFALVEGDVRDEATCRACCDGMDVVLHQAALGSVPRSLRDPRATHAVNVDGFVHVALAARDAGVRALVYAS